MILKYLSIQFLRCIIFSFVLMVKTVPVATEYFSSKTISPFSFLTGFPFSSTFLPSFEGLFQYLQLHQL